MLKWHLVNYNPFQIRNLTGQENKEKNMYTNQELV